MTATLNEPQATDLPTHLQRLEVPGPDVGNELLQLIRDAIENHPRSLQKRIGPSEIGHECARRVGYKLAGVPERDNQRPNWKAQVGTWGHAGLEAVLDDANIAYATRTGSGQERFYIETRVDVGEIAGQTITGSCDVFDRVTGSVIDWKFVGPNMLKKYRKHGPGAGYRTQGHTYGRGWQRRGMTVRRVIIIFLARDGELADAYVWSEDYDESIAIAGLQRATGIKHALDAGGPAILAALPTADAYCTFCPFYRAGSTDPATSCPGHPSGDQQRSQDSILSLL